MRKVLMTLLLTVMLASPVEAMDLEAPAVPPEAAYFMPSGQESLGQALLEVIRNALLELSPSLKEACRGCLGVIGAVMAVSAVKAFPGSPQKTADMAGTAAMGVMLLQSADSMVNLAARTVSEISEYGKLLLPVMTAAMAAQGRITSSGALYAGTAFFDTFLSGLIAKLLIPAVYFFLLLAVAAATVGDEMLVRLRDGVMGIASWVLKTVLYIFTGYISITGVVSGTTDAAALKAAKLTISGAVPVVGGILSDASEAVLVTAGTVKNAAGVYGMFAVMALWLGPFLKIGANYLMLKAVGLVCGIFGSKEHSTLIRDFSGAMGLLLAMTGSLCLMLMISLVCYLKGGS